MLALHFHDAEEGEKKKIIAPFDKKKRILYKRWVRIVRSLWSRIITVAALSNMKREIREVLLELQNDFNVRERFQKKMDMGERSLTLQIPDEVEARIRLIIKAIKFPRRFNRFSVDDFIKTTKLQDS